MNMGNEHSMCGGSSFQNGLFRFHTGPGMVLLPWAGVPPRWLPGVKPGRCTPTCRLVNLGGGWLCPDHGGVKLVQYTVESAVVNGQVSPIP